MSVTVPSNYVWWVNAASAGTGIGYDYVACQINEESGFDPNVTSPTGAQGIAQFEPGTWATWGHGDPYNPTDALHAYIAFMNYLVQTEGGSLFRALAAYNAGPGNIAAGYGYATTIIDCAGGGSTTGGVRVSAGNPSVTAQGPPPGTDDWSGKVRNVAGQVNFAGTNMLSAADSIGRL
jgi:hypothetical protein